MYALHTMCLMSSRLACLAAGTVLACHDHIGMAWIPFVLFVLPVHPKPAGSA